MGTPRWVTTQHPEPCEERVTTGFPQHSEVQSQTPSFFFTHTLTFCCSSNVQAGKTERERERERDRERQRETERDRERQRERGRNVNYMGGTAPGIDELGRKQQRNERNALNQPGSQHRICTWVRITVTRWSIYLQNRAISFIDVVIQHLDIYSVHIKYLIKIINPFCSLKHKLRLFFSIP